MHLKTMTTLPRCLIQDKLKGFFAAIESPRDKALFALVYHDGLRLGEALMLTIDDVHFTSYRITIRGLKSGKSYTVVYPPTVYTDLDMARLLAAFGEAFPRAVPGVY
jgi:integrase